MKASALTRNCMHQPPEKCSGDLRECGAQTQAEWVAGSCNECEPPEGWMTAEEVESRQQAWADVLSGKVAAGIDLQASSDSGVKR